MMTPDTITTADFDRLTDLVYEQCGIRLGSHKKSMLVARLSKHIRRHGLSDFREYYERIRADTSGVAMEELIHSVTTHVTHFFREPDHFNFIAKTLRDWEEKRSTPIRIWCAACSTGEEPYSVAIAAREHMKDLSRLRILATDISTHVLAEARLGIFSEATLKETARPIRDRYFQRMSRDRADHHFQLDSTIVDMVRFAPINLAAPPYPMKGHLDIILCRNVMIYFDNDLRKRMLGEMHRLLKPSGYLLVGHAESLSGMLGSFKSVAPSVYVKNEPAS